MTGILRVKDNLGIYFPLPLHSFQFHFIWGLGIFLVSLVAQMVKRLSATWETQVQSLGWKDPPEKEMAIHYSTLTWKILWMEEPGRLQSMGLQRVEHN